MFSTKFVFNKIYYSIIPHVFVFLSLSMVPTAISSTSYTIYLNKQANKKYDFTFHSFDPIKPNLTSNKWTLILQG